MFDNLAWINKQIEMKIERLSPARNAIDNNIEKHFNVNNRNSKTDEHNLLN